MQKKTLGIMILVVLLAGSFIFAQLPEQPPVGEPPMSPEVPAPIKEVSKLPIDQLIEIVKSTRLGYSIVSIKSDKGVFGRDKGSYTFILDDGTEITIDKVTGEILNTKEGKGLDEETLGILAIVTVPLEDAVKTSSEAFPDNKLISVTLKVNELGNPIYEIEFDNINVQVDASTGQIIFPEGVAPTPQETLIEDFFEMPLEPSTPLEAPTEEETPMDEIFPPENTENF
ncbi:PepSY domain-containing protein [Petrotoga sp. 9PWA.NaAc.5.4]|uniref:PepSY domain-containing protein n=1 Tax=Petrotoga sp. 9PWA.NaAc.5.4 TaxID=1434328 RepID=UPI000CA948C8|nr:PepSY domain-containing protein [Petrotoga sp. 9PWA.NaAc.5.4]PNR96847.1 hypothetical protein X924_02345 [Petrotoga sp. 9PWA.NaAc.5.4]